jgi:hypothetical protein
VRLQGSPLFNMTLTVVEKLLTRRFIEHAVKTIRELARREREVPPAEFTAALGSADAQIGELER